MGYKNYISAYCNGTKVFKNYEVAGHPKKNAPYALRFIDNAFDGKSISVKIHSCQNEIDFVFSNMNFEDIQFTSELWPTSKENPDQCFRFVAARGLYIVFYEDVDTTADDMQTAINQDWICYGRCLAAHLGNTSPYITTDHIHGKWIFNVDENTTMIKEKKEEESNRISYTKSTAWW